VGEQSKAVINLKIPNPACRECPVKHLCTSRPAGREIDRSQYAQAVEENNKRYQENPQLYRTRQEINEHIFGTIKDNGVIITLI
jgi:adenine-specific DNA glycosylase